LVDDHELVRAGVRALVALIPNVVVVAEAPDGLGLLSILRTTPADLVLCDVSMPRMDGLEVLRRVRQSHPSVRTVMLSMDESRDTAKRAMDLGAAGYVVKQSSPEEFQEAIRVVVAGGKYVSSSTLMALLGPGAKTPEEVLTPRQVEILTLVAKGLSSHEIGDKLGLSRKTVDVHRLRIMARLDIHDVASLTRYAMKNRLVR
jgi:two-component system nitrate/nitrite response regulator NarL